MSLSTAVSVASFSIVLAETFAAVGLSTIVPTAVVTLARIAKQLAGTTALASTDQDDMSDALSNVGKADKDVNPGKAVGALAAAIGKALPSLDMLLPKDAKIHAEFSYEGKDSQSLSVSGGGQINVVNVSAGYSALYEAKSMNKITLDINFVSVNIPL